MTETPLTQRQRGVLSVLDREGYPLTAAEVGIWAHIDHARQVLLALARRGWVEQNSNGYWLITDFGRAAAGAQPPPKEQP